VLTWFKKIHEEYGEPEDVAHELMYLKDFIKDLKQCKFPVVELDALKLFKKKVEEGSTPDEIITITMGVKGDVKKKIAQLLQSISSTCSQGASRTWGIINGDRGEGAKVDFDGDGADQLIDVKINGQRVKDYLA